MRQPGFFALAAFAVEKEVEAIEIARLALGVDSVEKSNYDSQLNDAGETILTSRKIVDMYDGNNGTVTSISNKAFLVEASPSAENQNQIVKVSSAKTNSQFTSSVGTIETILVLEKNYSLVVESVDSEKLQITLQTEVIVHQRNSKFAGNETVYPYNLKVSLMVDRESLRHDTISVLSASHDIAWKLASGKSNHVETKGENHKVVSAGGCLSLTGDSVILTDRTKKVLSYQDSKAEVAGSSFKTVAGQCEKRPTVDLTRFLIF